MSKNINFNQSVQIDDVMEIALKDMAMSSNKGSLDFKGSANSYKFGNNQARGTLAISKMRQE